LLTKESYNQRQWTQQHAKLTYSRERWQHKVHGENNPHLPDQGGVLGKAFFGAFSLAAYAILEVKGGRWWHIAPPDAP